MGKIVSSRIRRAASERPRPPSTSASLAACERNVLLVDLDPKANATPASASSKNEAKSMYPVLTDGLSIREIIRPTELPNFHLAPSSVDLVAAEIELSDEIGREFYLTKPSPTSLEGLRLRPDRLPAVSGAADNERPRRGELRARPDAVRVLRDRRVAQLMSTVERVRDILNPGLEIEGIALTMYDERMNLARQVAEEVRTHFREKVYKTVIPRNVRLGEAPRSANRLFSTTSVRGAARRTSTSPRSSSSARRTSP